MWPTKTLKLLFLKIKLLVLSATLAKAITASTKIKLIKTFFRLCVLNSHPSRQHVSACTKVYGVLVCCRCFEPAQIKQREKRDFLIHDVYVLASSPTMLPKVVVLVGALFV